MAKGFEGSHLAWAAAGDTKNDCKPTDGRGVKAMPREAAV
jgi:hypothetical protein